MIKSWSMAIKKLEKNFLTSSKEEYIHSFSQGVVHTCWGHHEKKNRANPGHRGRRSCEILNEFNSKNSETGHTTEEQIK